MDDPLELLEVLLVLLELLEPPEPDDDAAAPADDPEPDAAAAVLSDFLASPFGAVAESLAPSLPAPTFSRLSVR